MDGVCRDTPDVTLPRFSLVVPLYQEAGNVRPLMDAVRPVLAGLAGDYEVVLVNDGSTDGTREEIDELAADDPHIRPLHLERNAGQAFALLSGLRHARGQVMLTMDGDGQNDPRDFPLLIACLERDEADLACGIRTPREDSGLRRVMSRLANRVRGRVLKDGVSDAGCQLRAFRRELVSVLEPSALLQSFIPAIAVHAGFRVCEREVRHHPRRAGESKYGLRNLSWTPMVQMVRWWWRLRGPGRARRMVR